MRVLILSCSTGEGHNSCAGAIKEVYDAGGDVCDIADSLAFISPKVSRFICWGHVTVYRHLSGLFKWGYAYSEKHPGVFRQGSPVYHLLTGGTERLYAFIKEGQYDAVICVHVFAALLLTVMKKKHPMELKTCFVATDYTCSPSVEESDLDRCFIPDEALAGEFECPNIPRSKMVGSGIPIRQMFYQRGDPAEAKERFGIDRTHTHLLVMCGSMGCGPLKRLTQILSRRAGEDCEITVVCGTNEKLRRALEKKYRGKTNIHIRGYVKQMGALMDSADLYLTKPGGLSVTEAAVKDLPMVYIDAVAGCEEYNRRYFVDLGGAATADTVAEVADVCLRLLEDPEKRQRMSAVLAARQKVNAAAVIRDTMRSA